MRNLDACLYVGPSDRATLERLIADGKTPQKIVKRATIVLLSGRGLGTNAIMREAGVSKPSVWRWQQAYMEGGVARLLRDKGKGPKAGKPRISDQVRLAIVTRTAKEKPANATHWSARQLAEEMGVGHTTVQRIWKQHGLKPHLARTFKLSNDPNFAEKVVDIVGLYLNPPDKAALPDELNLPTTDDEVRQLLRHFQFGTPLGHLEQAIEAHTRGDWAAANGQLRTFLESLFDGIASRVSGPEAAQAPSFENRRALLASKGFLSVTRNEWTQDGKNYVNGLFKMLHTEGSHPGLSDEDHCTFRLHVVLVTARTFLRRLHNGQ